MFSQEQCFLDRLGSCTALTDVVFPSGNYWKAYVDIEFDGVKWEPAYLGSSSFDSLPCSFLEHWWWSSDASAGLVEIVPPSAYVLASLRPASVVPPLPWKTAPTSTIRSKSPLHHRLTKPRSRSSTPTPIDVEDIIITQNDDLHSVQDGEPELQLFESGSISFDDVDPHLRLEMELDFDLDAELEKHDRECRMKVDAEVEVQAEDDEESDEEESERVSPPRPSNPTSSFRLDDVTPLFAMESDEDDSEEEDDDEDGDTNDWRSGSAPAKKQEPDRHTAPTAYLPYTWETDSTPYSPTALNPAKRRMAIYL